MADDKLPMLFSPSATVSFAARSTLSRGVPFATVLPSLGTLKAESPRPQVPSRLYSKRHSSAFSRYGQETVLTDQSSSSSAWWTLNNDNKRYAAIAAARAHSVLEKFNEKLKGYTTFLPIVVDEGLYSTHSIHRRFHGESVSDSLSKLTDYAAARSVRSFFDDSFVSTVEKATGSQSNFAPRMAERKRPTVKTPEGTEMSSSSLSLYSDKFTATIELWLRENSNASEEEFRQKRLFYDSQRAKSEQKELSQYRQKWQAKLDALHEERLDALAHSKQVLLASKRMSTAGKGAPSTEQRIVWTKFLSSENNVDLIGSPRTKVTTWKCGDIYTKDNLHDWIEKTWRSSTHRHEEAALKIQCAYRCFRSKEEAARRRYARQMVFARVLSLEVESQERWEKDVQTRMLTHDTQGSVISRSAPSTKFIEGKLLAIIAKRRIRKEKEAKERREVEEYAATCIQRVYRGYWSRFWVKLMRNGDPVEQLRQIRISKVIVRVQACWRGHVARAAIKRQHAAALAIQCLARKAAALRVLYRKRREKRMEVEYEIHRHHIKVIVRALKRCVCQRQQYMKERWDQLFLIQRVGRGRIGRAIVEKIYKRMCAARLCVALALQRCYRGWRGRVAAQHERVRRDERHLQLRCRDAARVIERNWLFARKHYSEKMARVRLEKQRITRELRRQRREKLNLRRMRIAALKIQHWYLNTCYIRQVRERRNEKLEELIRRESAERIIRFYRGYKSRMNKHTLPEVMPIVEGNN